MNKISNHKTTSFDNEVHPGGMEYISKPLRQDGVGHCIMCCKKKMYMDVFPYDIQGKISLMQEWIEFFKRCSIAELSYIKKDSYQYDHS